MQTKYIAHFMLLTAFGVTSIVSTAKEVTEEHVRATLNVLYRLAEDKRLAGGAITLIQAAKHYDMEFFTYPRDLIDKRESGFLTLPTRLTPLPSDDNQVFAVALQSDASSPETPDNPTGESGTSEEDC